MTSGRRADKKSGVAPPMARSFPVPFTARVPMSPRSMSLLGSADAREADRSSAAAAAKRMRRSVRLDGIVQGVGLRPFVYALATDLGLSGRVANDNRGVVVEVEGQSTQVAEFLARLPREARSP